MKGEEGSPARADHFSDVAKLALSSAFCEEDERRPFSSKLQGPHIRYQAGNLISGYNLISGSRPDTRLK